MISVRHTAPSWRRTACRPAIHTQLRVSGGSRPTVASALGLSLGELYWRQSARLAWRRAFVVSAACYVPGRDLVATSHGDGTLHLWRGVLRDAAVSFGST